MSTNVVFVPVGNREIRVEISRDTLRNVVTAKAIINGHVTMSATGLDEKTATTRLAEVLAKMG